MKLFVAIEIGPDAARAAGRLIATLRDRLARVAPGARVTWVPEPRLHLTVRFIGAVSDAVGAGVRDALAPPLPLPAFDLRLSGLGTFPDRRPPRVVWLGMREGSEGVIGIRREVDARLASLPIPPADGPLRPHLTLGRVRVPAGLLAARLVEGIGEEASAGVVRVEAVTLFESRASPAGPAYVPLHRTALAGSDRGGPLDLSRGRNP